MSYITAIHPLFTEWYMVNGESMATYGWSIESVTTGLPERKGDNVTSPIMHGSMFREKRFGPRTDTWNIWVCDADPETGVIPSTETGKRAQFNANMEKVNLMLNPLYGLLAIEKHFRLGLDNSNEGIDNYLTSYGEISSAYSYDDAKQFNCALFSVDITYPYPFWIAAESSNFAINGNVAGIYTDIIYDGSAPQTSMTITINAGGTGCTNPKILASGPGFNPCQIGYTGSLTAGQSVVIDTSTYSIAKGGNNAITSLFRSGSRQDWFELYPGSNQIYCQSSVGTFTVGFEFNNLYFAAGEFVGAS